MMSRRIRVENVRAVFVHQHAGIVVAVECVAAYMRPPIYNQHLLIALARDPFCEDASSKPRADYQPIEQKCTPIFESPNEDAKGMKVPLSVILSS